MRQLTDLRLKKLWAERIILERTLVNKWWIGDGKKNSLLVLGLIDRCITKPKLWLRWQSLMGNAFKILHKLYDAQRFCLQECTRTLAPARLHLHNLRHVISSVISKGNKPNNSSNVTQCVLQQHYFDDDFYVWIKSFFYISNVTL